MTKLSGAGRNLYMDTEGNGLLTEQNGIKAITMMHCLGVIDMDTMEEFYFGPPVPKDHPVLIGKSEAEVAVLTNPSGTVVQGMVFMSECELLVGHNTIGFDYPACEKLYPKHFVRPPKAWDSLVAAKRVWPYDVLLGPDLARIRAGTMPTRMMKSHSMKAWGYRLGDNKDDYDGDKTKYPEPSDRLAVKGDERFDRRWEEWNPWMASYMMQDCRPGVKLWKLIEQRVGWHTKEDGSPSAEPVWPEFVFEYEHEVARIVFEQQQFGIRFDRDKAEALCADLTNTKADINAKLVETFGSWWQPDKDAEGNIIETTPAVDRKVKLTHLPDVTKRRFSEKTGKELAPYVGPPVCQYFDDAPYVSIEFTTFQPSSRDHLGQRLQDVFGWKPKKFGKNKKPTVDETVLEEIPEAVIPAATRQLILDYFVVNKTLGMLKSGGKAWLSPSVLKDDDHIHGRVDPSGAITTRATHSSPNLAQVPAVLKEKDLDGVEHVLKGLRGRYGWECRELFIAEEGEELTGVDASSLELIDLGHYLVPYDDGAFRDRACDPSRSVHDEHADLTGRTRAETKTATYLYIYGGSAYKLSLDTTVEDHEIPELLCYRGLTMLLSNLAKRFDQDFVDKLDDRQKARIAKARQVIVAFEGGIEGIKPLKKDVTDTARARGWLKGLDGSKLHVRKPHAALNTLLQSAGAMTCKVWMMLIHRKMKALGYTHGVEYRQVLFVHDEMQFSHIPGLHEVLKKVCYEAIEEAGQILGLRGTYRAEAKSGPNWACTH